MQKVVFFFPKKAITPNPVYLCHLADQLAEDSNYEVYYVEHVNGAADHLLTNYRARRIPFTGNARKMSIFPEEPVVLLMPMEWAKDLPELHPDSRVILINWNRASIPALQKAWKTEQSDLDRYLELIHQHNGVFFSDKTDQLAQNSLTEMDHADTFVPHIITAQEIDRIAQVLEAAAEHEAEEAAREAEETAGGAEEAACEAEETAGEAEEVAQETEEAQEEDFLPEETVKEEINVAIWSDLNADTIYPMIEILNSIADIPLDDMLVNVHIVGKGKKENLLYKRRLPEHIKLTVHETMTEEETFVFLSRQADVVFAQRTQALIAGILGLPTVIFPESQHYFSANRYVFLHQAAGYALRWVLDEMEELGMDEVSAAEIISKVHDQTQKEEIGETCRNYVMQTHTENVEFLKTALEQCSLRFEMVSSLLPPASMAPVKTKPSVPFTQRVRQGLVKVMGTPVKQYRLFGIPFFTLRKVHDDQYNLFFMDCVPLLRAKYQKKKYNLINILPLIWVKAIIKKLWTKITAKKQKAVPPVDYEALRRKRIDEKLARNEKIRVCLFEPRVSCWQFGKIYQLLENSDVFEPIVVVAPFPFMGKEAMIEYMDTTYEALKNEGYRVVKTYNKITDTYMDIKKEIDPDAVFYSMFWKNHFHDNWYITKFRDVYSFLYPYGFDVYYHPINQAMNFELQNLVTRYYQPTRIHVAMAQDNMNNGGINAYATGSPKLDSIIDPDYKPVDPWKDQTGKKRIIWAPHHSLKMSADYAQLCAFFDLSDYMLELAEKYQDSVCFAFKPHPMLKPKLYDMWGQRKTDEYYDAWANGVNTQLEEGEFVDLFITSDAMILDSISFVAEYTYTNKPAFFTYAKETRFPTNRFGTAVLKMLYRNKTSDTLNKDIQTFVEEVVINGNDTKAQERTEFIQKHMRPAGGRLAAENIYEDMCRVILDNQFDEYKIDWSDTYDENK